VKTKLEERRVYRGGGWYDFVPSWLRGGDRDESAPSGRYTVIGFRPVLDSQKEKPREE